MSIEWSRIEPSEGDFKKEEIDHYLKVFESLKSRGIKISLTLVHYAFPQWFEEKGSFSDMENLKYFERYVEYVVPKVKDYVDEWCVLNEHNGAIAPSMFDYKINSIRFHARAYHIIKRYSDKKVSTAHAFILPFAKRQSDKFDRAIQDYQDIIINEYFFHAIRTGEIVLPYKDGVYDKEVKNTCDFWAVNTYGRRIIDARKKDAYGESVAGARLDLLPKVDFRYMNEFYPENFASTLTRLSDKPVVITENGINCYDDDFRIVYILEYLSALSEVIKMGVEVKGYYHWSLLDNYEWGSFVPKFGLVSVDRENGFKRTIKRSGYFLRDIIENNGYKPEMLVKYLTETPKIKPYNDDIRLSDAEILL
jgi:beta-glucosidase